MVLEGRFPFAAVAALGVLRMKTADLFNGRTFLTKVDGGKSVARYAAKKAVFLLRSGVRVIRGAGRERGTV